MNPEHISTILGRVISELQTAHVNLQKLSAEMRNRCDSSACGEHHYAVFADERTPIKGAFMERCKYCRQPRSEVGHD